MNESEIMDKLSVATSSIEEFMEDLKHDFYKIESGIEDIRIKNIGTASSLCSLLNNISMDVEKNRKVIKVSENIDDVIVELMAKSKLEKGVMRLSAHINTEMERWDSTYPDENSYKEMCEFVVEELARITEEIK